MEVAKKKGSNFNGKSGGLGFLITAGALFLLSSKLLIPGILIGLGVGAVLGIMGSKLDTTTHNKRDEQHRQQEAEASRRQQETQDRLLAEQKRFNAAAQIPLTGDPVADKVITTGVDMLQTIRAENVLITDETLSAQMDTLTDKCQQIFRTVSESPAKAPQVRKFINYYLPTTLKMLANYRTMQERGVSYQDMAQARETTIRGMNMVLTACQKQIDNLHRDNMLDISTDIDVMEQMLKRDGYIENEITGGKNLSGARTAAEAQMRASAAPVLDFPEEKKEDPSLSSAHYIAK